MVDQKENITAEKNNLQNGKLNFEKRKKYSTSSVMILLVLISIVGLFYTSNVIKVNELLMENSVLNNDLSKIKDENVLLKVTISKLESYDRISNLAQNELGLVHPKEPPQFFEIKD